MIKKLLLIAVSAALSTAAHADAYSPWTPGDESSELTFRFSAQQADDFYAGDKKVPLSAVAGAGADLSQDGYTLDYSYGISDQLALDLRVGYTSSDFVRTPGLAPNGGLSGVQDSRIGLRYNLTGAQDDLPTITFGLAWLIAGNYDTGALPAVGDGESGIEVSVLVGQAFDSGFLLSGGYSRRQYNGNVPDENAFNIGAGYAFNDVFSAGLFYQNVRGNGNLDIGAPGFSPARFPEVDEDFSLWGVGGSFSLNDAWSLGLDYGRKISGRNTAKSDFYSLSATYLF